MRNLLLTFFVAASLCCDGQGYKPFYDAAIAAYGEKNYEKFYKDINEAGKLHPYHQGILYLRGKAAAITGRNDEAIACLKKAILINAAFPLERVPDFDSIKSTSAFAALLALQKEQWNPVIQSDTAFVIKDRKLHTEGITFHSKQNLFYAGSIHQRKIVSVTPNGMAKDFCAPGFDDMTSIFGLAVDSKKKSLWAASSPMEEMENYDASLPSTVFNFNLNGKLIRKFTAEKSGVFGDLVLTRKGDVYVSDSKNNQVLKIGKRGGKLELFFSSPEFWNIQGLAFTPDESVLFISDYIKGVFRLDVKTKELTLLVSPEDYSMKGIDGLYFYKNSLIAIQNGVSPLRVSRFFLDPGLRTITKASLLDRAHPAFNEPTLGVLTGNTFYYIANSQWGGYTEQHQQKPVEQLQDIVILKCELDKLH